MKMFAIIFFTSAAVLASAAEVSLEERRERGTYNAVARAKIVLRCIDQDGQAVSNAIVSSGVTLDGNPQTSTPIKGVTDKDGCFVVEGRSNGELGYRCSKEGYYDTWEVKRLANFPEVYVADGCWQPYGMTNTVVLKRMINPVAMTVASWDSKDHHIPFVGKEIGFDFFDNDWTAPNGKGKCADLYVSFDWDGSKYQNYTGSKLTLVFKDAYSGVYKIKTDEFSKFKSPYHALTNGNFVQEMKFSYLRGIKASETFNGQLKGDECLILRVRTKVDDDGNLVSAHYAKIYGPMMFGYALESPGSMEMRYYLNPNENDPNLEADTTKNLLNPRDLNFSP